MTNLNRYGMLVIILLIVIIAFSGAVVWSKYSPGEPIEIPIPKPPSQQQLNQIYIGGAVTNPGFYSLTGGDTVEYIIQAAGGTSSGADLSQLRLYILQTEPGLQPQKINLNRAEAWLLEALPGIGQTTAQAIIEYRNQNGLFSNITELTKVEGIGTITYEKIKDLITVAD